MCDSICWPGLQIVIQTEKGLLNVLDIFLLCDTTVPSGIAGLKKKISNSKQVCFNYPLHVYLLFAKLMFFCVSEIEIYIICVHIWATKVACTVNLNGLFAQRDCSFLKKEHKVFCYLPVPFIRFLCFPLFLERQHNKYSS